MLRLHFILASGTCNGYRWKYYNGSCYYFSARYTRVDYHNAKTYCNKMGAELVSIQNAAENEFVRTQMRGWDYSNNSFEYKVHITHWSSHDRSIYLSIHPSICLSIYLSIYPSIYLSIYLSISVSISISIYVCTVRKSRHNNHKVKYS